MFTREFAKFCQHNGCVGCFLRPEQGLEDLSILYFNSFYFIEVHPNLTGIAYYGKHQHVEEITT
jgi:hypothetical protein